MTVPTPPPTTTQPRTLTDDEFDEWQRGIRLDLQKTVRNEYEQARATLDRRQQAIAYGFSLYERTTRDVEDITEHHRELDRVYARARKP